MINPEHVSVLHHALRDFLFCLTKECTISPFKEKRTSSEAVMRGVL